MLNHTETLEVINNLRLEGIDDRVISAIIMTNLKRDVWKLLGENATPSTCSNIRVGMEFLEAAKT